MHSACRAPTVWFLLLATAPMLGGWHPPEVAMSRKQFEAAYPKRTVSSAALELERLAADIGIDAAPLGPVVSDPDAEDRVRRLQPDDGRARPDPEVAKIAQSGVSAVGHWVDQEISEPSDRIGPPPAAVARYLEDSAAAIDSIVAVAAGTRPIEWDLDVAAGREAPMPNLLGLTKIQRLLAARGLLQIREGETDAAVVTIDGMWRISESLASLPNLLSQLIVASHLRMIVGLLRKVDGPAFGWEERLREGAFFKAFLAGLQNDPWSSSQDPEFGPTIETLTRVYRRFADGLIERSVCDWTKESLQHSWEVAVSGENETEQIIMGIASESIIDMILRSHRVLLDSELTALVLEARAERAASRKGEWPRRLPNLESTVCPGRFYSYRRAGGVTLAFEGTAPSGERHGLGLPLTFRGLPPPTPTTTLKPTSALTPTPTPHTLTL